MERRPFQSDGSNASPCLEKLQIWRIDFMLLDKRRPPLRWGCDSSQTITLHSGAFGTKAVSLLHARPLNPGT